MLTDIDNGYALSLNLAIWLGTEIQQLRRSSDLPDYQGNDAWMLPIPATFVVGRDGWSRPASSIRISASAWRSTICWRR